MSRLPQPSVRRQSSLDLVPLGPTAVAVKKLVVGSRRVEGGTLLSVTALLPVVFARGFRVLLIECPGMLAGLL